ncbi:hypothetical protein [Ralstonia phage RP13]|nr:hypothetical protein [Ralstonia phage RP13]
MATTLPYPSPSWIYEGLDPSQWENATGTVINRAPKQLLLNDIALAAAIDAANANIGNLRTIASLDLLTPPNIAGVNTLMTGSLDDSNNLIMAFGKSTTVWTFNTHNKTVASGTVASSTTTNITSTSIKNLIVDLLPGRYIIQFTSGVLAGYARIVTVTANNSVSWNTALPSAPAVNASFEIYQSNAYLFNYLQTISDQSIVNAIVFGG